MKNTALPNPIHFGLFIILLFVCSPVQADRSDWVLVERFENQLKQANVGKVTAMYEVGRMYERGRGTDLDYKKAAAWYQKASEAGNLSAKAQLGTLYLTGKGVKQDHAKAYRLLSAAASAGVPSAQYQLGMMYEWGTGVAKNRDKALYWYNQALKGGDYRASSKLAKLKAQKPAPSAPAGASKATATIAVSNKATSSSGKKGKPNSISTLETVLNNKWLDHNHPTAYLPSAISQCQRNGTTSIHCKTVKQKRNTDAETIVFDTEAQLVNFRDKRFTIRYVNTIVEVKPHAATADAMDEDDTDVSAAVTAASSNIKVGQKSRQRTLDCQLIDATHLRCTRDKIRTYDFHS